MEFADCSGLPAENLSNSMSGGADLLHHVSWRPESRAGQGLAWLGILNLAVLHAGGGWAAYVTAPGRLLFCLVASEAR